MVSPEQYSRRLLLRRLAGKVAFALFLLLAVPFGLLGLFLVGMGVRFIGDWESLGAITFGLMLVAPSAVMLGPSLCRLFRRLVPRRNRWETESTQLGAKEPPVLKDGWGTRVGSGLNT